MGKGGKGHFVLRRLQRCIDRRRGRRPSGASVEHTPPTATATATTTTFLNATPCPGLLSTPYIKQHLVLFLQHHVAVDSRCCVCVRSVLKPWGWSSRPPKDSFELWTPGARVLLNCWRQPTYPTYPPVFSIHSAHDPRGVQPSPFPPFVSVFPDLRRELGAIVGPSPLLQRPPPGSEQAEPRALRTRLCPFAAGQGPFAEG